MVEDAKARFTDDCTSCGACVSACPADAIVMEVLRAQEVDTSQYNGIWVVALLKEIGLVSSNGEARRLISQGGVYLNGNRVELIDMNLTIDNIEDGCVLIRVGKKRYHRVIISG